jgi:A nuclease of the HNH/ENDO VII superfamily with conserved WHH
MTDVRLAQASTTIAQAPTQQLDPVLIANKILADNTRGGRLDFSAIKRAVDAVSAQNRDLGARVLQAVEAQLSPTQRGELARATYPLNAGGGATFSITPGAPSLESQFREPAGSAGRENYNFFDRTFGDGNLATFDGPRIYEGIRQLQASGLTLDQFVQQQADIRRDISRAIDQLNPVNRLSDLVQPYIADIARSAGLGGSEWGARLQAVLDTPGGFAAFREGFNQGVLKGAEDFVVGIASLAGRAVQYGADNTPFLGSGGDALRGLTGQLPGWLDAIVPSARRGEESNAALGQLGASFAGYVSSRAGNPAQIGEDIKGAIDKIWESVKADHAQAAAQGPAAEARWWGNLLGRVTFEVASTVVPVGKLGNVGKLADAATDLARTADRALDLSRLTRVAGDALSTARQAILDPAFGTAARGKLEDTLNALRRINEGALPAAERTALRESKDALEEAIEIARPRQSGVGNPGAVFDNAAPLGARQTGLLNRLPADGSRIVIGKGEVSIQDIAALTARTGDEFAIFTKGNERMILRGNGDRIEVSPQLLQQLKSEGWRWSAHSQPGTRIGDAVASAADQRVLRELGQNQSLIVNSRGDANIFTQTSTSARQVPLGGVAVAIRNADGTLNLAAASERYASLVSSNRPWSWADDFGVRITGAERRAIRQEAITNGLIPEVVYKPGTRYPDFAAAGIIQRVDSLPANLWKASDSAQFTWLDARIPGGRPAGTTWHHSEIPGRMELVPFGPHNIINHAGGRSPGNWAHAPR